MAEAFDKEKAAFTATFADFKLVKTRSAAQFVFELKVEGGDADAALKALGGLPTFGVERRVAIALLDQTASVVLDKTEYRDVKPDALEEKPKQAFADLPLPKQAGIRCGERAFWRFLEERKAWHGRGPVGDANVAAEAVRRLLGVTSRAELGTDPAKGRLWIGLNREFEVWMKAPEIA